ncbi:two-component regulator propeller domain-containing protein [Dysgonomonas sp. 520]|uniref:two-component regulator propeller domain-containing protein n=1 Tax=Dysgonomonas sp. 520 TaxID=2302931 RepID=UPI0013D22565|nr:two-component regulator propeller domain-containing protein [Dysgonomonas sp. 520]NDW10891.1 hybrid sensor histidine kinase/response regulator [Dysgonomonas sp. 520]
MTRYFFSLIALFLCLSVHAESAADASYYFSRINNKSGLSQVNVKAIIQDSYGFVWFGTRNQLNRYDGSRMKVFNCYDTDQKRGDNNISALYEDDNRELWVGTDKGIYIFNPIDEKFSFFDKATEKGIKITDWVSTIQRDSDNNIWVVIPNEGIFRYHAPSQKLYHYIVGDLQKPNKGGNPQCMCIEKNGEIWVGTNGSGVFNYDKSKDSFTQYLGDNQSDNSLKDKNIYTMCDYGDELVLGIHEEKLRKLNKRKNTLSDVNAPDVHYKIIRCVTRFGDELWVGTEAGLFIINELKNKTVHLQEDPMYPYSLSDNVIESICKDKENGIWIGTRFGGVNYLAKKGLDFECYVPLSNSENVFSSRRLREIKEDWKGNIWIASEDKGLDIFDPNSKTFSRIKKNGVDYYKNSKVLGLYLEKEEAWVGFFKNGLDVIKFPDFNITHYTGDDLNLDEASIYSICEDKFGKMWVGNGWGVFVGDKDKKGMKRMDKFGLCYVYDIMEDSKGYIWVATLGSGLFKYNQTTGEVQHFLNKQEDSLSLSSNSVSSITETSLGEIWLATDRGGICRYNRESDNFTTFSIEDGLPDDVSYKIVEDKNHNLWFGTNKGLVKFNPQTKRMKIFSEDDGLPINQFNYKSALLSSTGKLYFGGLNGLLAFDPEHYEENKFVPPVYITQLIIHNNVVNLNTENSPLDKSMPHTQKIKLRHDQSNIGFNFVALSFVAPKANKYAYMMEGVDDDWNYINTNQTVSYAKLPPGKYIFRVKGCNNDELWNEEGASVEIEILPPWWWSNLALFSYIVLCIVLLYYLLNRYRKRTEKRQNEKQRLFESEKEKELYSSKVEFFTNIAHEIRTPVTLINGPLESMLEMEIEDTEITKNLNIMSKNTNDLLGLVNQLLDFRKVDSNKFLLNLSQRNISAFLKETYARFEPTAHKQKQVMSIILPPEDVWVVFDKEGLTKIVNNLLSNALRYGNEFVEIELTTDEDFVYVKVKNDGELIPLELSETIFDPFYQGGKHRNSPSSSGIGLSLARSLAELHNGYLYYNQNEDMNEFVLQLPVNTETEPEIEELPEKDYIIEESELRSEGHKAEVILLVEDNVEMLNFIAGRMQKQFGVEKAANGVEAMKILKEKNIDLVLTDIMMPEMDGFELCKNIKESLEYSHIPVVLVTAKNDLQSKIQGLEVGADAYIEKPFSMNHLIIQLTTLLSNRRREKEAFMRKPFLPIQNIGMNKADEEFVEKIISIIEENITDPEFSVERLAESVFMSRSNLHRKIKALTELTSIDFIRLIRLKKAAELIQSGKYRTGEVCYLVGINSPSYFIKLFQKQFGMTPKEFAKQQS